MGRTTFKKITTSKELLSQVNSQNVKLGERFLREKGTRCSEKTIENYRSDLNIFWCWNYTYNDDVFFIDLQKFELSDFFAYAVSDLKWGSARFKRMRSTLSSFSDFIERYYDRQYPEFRNMVLKSIETMPANPRREKTVLSQEQVDKIFEFYKSKGELQKACLFALACYSGARKSELIRFTTDIIDENNIAFDVFLETVEAIKTKGRGRDGKKLHKYIIRDLFLPHYKLWLEKRAEILEENKIEDHGFVFIDEGTGLPITSPNSVGRWLVALEKEIGVVVYAHCLRHYLATYLVKIGLEVDLIVHLFGWESSEMLKIYNDLTAKDREWKSLGKLKDAISKD